MKERFPLREGWQLARSAPGACAEPAGLAAHALEWRAAVVPGTVALALRHDAASDADFDAHDWWYRTTFTAAPAGRRHFLRFDGLATLAEVWLNGERLLDSRNMFRAHRVEVTGRLRDVNQLAIRFASLDAALAPKRPRPRWKTRLVEAQNLRAFRTTLLGRMPGWNPSVAPVGPWRDVVLEATAAVDVATLELQPRAEAGRGHLGVRAAVSCGAATVDGARIRVNGAAHELAVVRGHDLRVHGDLDLGAVPLWWPHTHGEPRRVPWSFELRVDGEWVVAEAGEVGFRALALETRAGSVRFVVNGVPVFCRGACWSPGDLRTLADSPQVLRATLERARDAGLNMLRVGGTMAYETPAFYEACDALGILVWQDFMFANMDYPAGDAAFAAEVEAEAREQVQRLQRHACVAAYCGGSEVAQQAAMMGLEARHWSNALFDEVLPRLCATHHPGVPYFPSTPSGGALPFHVGSGVAHYYGVGAYRRPLSDLKTARVKFAAECLAFSNVPEPAAMRRIAGGAAPPPHHPRWKARVPRDNGAGWDFEDVRDHYLRELYGVDPVALRSRDLERYYALSRAVTGEVMRRAFAEWRAPASGCGGALVWLYRDFLPGAGWGLIDGDGAPKAAWWHLKRAWAARSVHLTDEGLDGAAVHVVNDRDTPLEATVEVSLLRDGRVLAASGARALQVAPHAALTLSADALMGRFTDAMHAYRFGPPQHEVVAVRLAGRDGRVLSEDFLFPSGMDLPRAREARIEIAAEPLAGGRVAVRLASDVFLQGVHAECEGFEPDDNHFHLLPGAPKVVTFSPRGPAHAFRADFAALNAAVVAEARLAAPTGAANGGGREGSNPFVA